MINIHIISHPRSGSTYLGLLAGMLYDAKLFSEPFRIPLDPGKSIVQIEEFIASKKQSCVVKNQISQINHLYENNNNYYDRFMECGDWKQLALYRKNLFAVSCSYAFGLKTNYWHELKKHPKQGKLTNSINQVDYPVIIDQQQFMEVCKDTIRSVDQLFEYISNNPSISVVCYEDLALNYNDDIGVFPWPKYDNYHIVHDSVEIPVAHSDRISNILECYTTFKQAAKQVDTKFYQLDNRDNII